MDRAWQRPGAAGATEHHSCQTEDSPLKPQAEESGPLHDIDWDWSVLDALRGALGRGEDPDASRAIGPARAALRSAKDDGAPFGASPDIQDDDVLQAFHADSGAAKRVSLLLQQGAAPSEAAVCAAISTRAAEGGGADTQQQLMLDSRDAWKQYAVAEAQHQLAVRAALRRVQSARNAASAAEEEWSYTAAMRARQEQSMPSPSPAARHGMQPGGAAFRGFGGDVGGLPSAFGAEAEDGQQGGVSKQDVAAAARAAAAAAKEEAKALQAAADLAASAPALTAPPPTYTLGGGVHWGEGPLLVLASGLGHVSVRLAEALRNSTVLSVAWPAAAAPGGVGGLLSPAQLHAQLKRLRGVQNNPTVEAGVHAGTLATLHAAHVPWAAVLLDDLQRMTGSLLHDEFLELLGSVLTLSRRTVLLQGKLPDTRFFSYWGSLDELVTAAARTADVVATVRTEKEGGVAWGSTPRKVVIVSVQTTDEAEAESAARAALEAAAAKAAAAFTAAAASKSKKKDSAKLPRVLLPSDDEPEDAADVAPVPPPLPADCLSVDLLSSLRAAGVPVASVTGGATLRTHLPHLHHMHIPSIMAALLAEQGGTAGAAPLHPWEAPEDPPFKHATSPPDTSLLPPSPPTVWMDLPADLRTTLQLQAVVGWSRGVPVSLLHALGLSAFDAHNLMVAVAMPRGAPGTSYHPPGTPPSHLLWAGERIVGVPPHVVHPAVVPRRISQHTAVVPVLPSPSPKPEKGTPHVPPSRRPDAPKSDALKARSQASGGAGFTGQAPKPIGAQPSDSTFGAFDEKPATRTKPLRGDDTKPLRGDDTKPLRGDDTKPLRGDDTKPLRGDDTKPFNDEAGKPSGGLRGKGAARSVLDLPDAASVMRGTVLSGESASLPAGDDVTPEAVLSTVAAATQRRAAGALDSDSPAAALGEILPPAYFAAAAVAAADASLTQVAPIGVGPADAAADAAWAHRVRHSAEGRGVSQWPGASDGSVPGAQHAALLRGGWGWIRHELGRVAVADSDAAAAAPHGHSTVLVSGAAASVLASKAARAFPGSLVLAAVGRTPDAGSLATLSDMLGQSNVMVLQEDIASTGMSNAAAVRDPFSAHVTDVSPLLAAAQESSSPQALVSALAQLMQAATTTLVLLPPWPVLMHALASGIPGEVVPSGEPPRGDHPPCDTHSSRNPAALLEALGVFGSAHAHAEAQDEPGSPLQAPAGDAAYSYPAPSPLRQALGAFSAKFGGGATDMLWSPDLTEIVHAYAARSPTASRSQCDVATGHACACVGGLHSEKPYKQLATAAAKQAGFAAPHITVHTLDLPASTAACPHHLLALRVDAGDWAVGEGDTSSVPQPQPLPQPAATGESTAPAAASRAGVSLFTLTSLGASPQVRRDVLRLYLSLPLPRIAKALQKAAGDKALPPWHVRVFLGVDGALRMSAGVPRAQGGGVRWFAAARGAGLAAAQREAAEQWSAMQGVLNPQDTASGGSPHTFSYLELGSGLGATALSVAAAHPKATVVSIEDSRLGSDVQLAASLAFGLNNALVCRHAVNAQLVRDLGASPEFFRFVHLAPPLTELLAEHGRADVSELVTGALQSGATSMLHIPGAELLSLAMASVFAPPAPPSQHAFRLAGHPTKQWAAAEWRLVSELVKPAANHDFAVRMRVLPVGDDSGAGGYGVRSPRAWGRLPAGTLSSGVVRVDITNMTRPVNHHFQSELDGHDRKYTLRVTSNGSLADGAGAPLAALGNHPNDGGRLSVHLERAKDKAGIPYTTLHGVTLIALLRLGLLAPLKARAYHQFVALPLYQDMAPWNIVFLGDALDYIDFDTRDRTYDHVVPAAFEVMEVLFNYKRTVEDFKRCGSKSPNLYNFPFLSDCVGSDVFRGPCPDTGKHVPCGDGKCHSDYISCLRAMSQQDMASGKAGWRHSVASTRLQLVESAASALRQEGAGALAAAAPGDASPTQDAPSGDAIASAGKRSADLGHGELRFTGGKYKAGMDHSGQ